MNNNEIFDVLHQLKIIFAERYKAIKNGNEKSACFNEGLIAGIKRTFFAFGIARYPSIDYSCDRESDICKSWNCFLNSWELNIDLSKIEDTKELEDLYC